MLASKEAIINHVGKRLPGIPPSDFIEQGQCQPSVIEVPTNLEAHRKGMICARVNFTLARDVSNSRSKRTWFAEVMIGDNYRGHYQIHIQYFNERGEAMFTEQLSERLVLKDIYTPTFVE